MSYQFELFALLEIGDFAWQVNEVKGDDVVCLIKNSATLAGSLFTLHASQVRIDLPTLSDKDKQVSISNIFDLYVLCFILSDVSVREAFTL